MEQHLEFFFYHYHNVAVMISHKKNGVTTWRLMREKLQVNPSKIGQLHQRLLYKDEGDHTDTS